MAASEMGFSRSGHPGTRRSRPAHSGEPPKHAQYTQRGRSECGWEVGVRLAATATRAGAVIPLRCLSPPSPRDLLAPRFFSPSTDPLSLLDSFHSRFLVK